MSHALRPLLSALRPLFLAIALLACQDQEKISFNRDIRPILNENCLVCHGGVKQLAGFSLLFPETAFGTTESGKTAIVPGNHRKSELYRRLVQHDPEERMPQEAPALSQQEIDLIARWIDEGAEWEDHWAYVAPVAVEPPHTDSPWAVRDIDKFILHELTQLGLTPADRAHAATLARRVSLDLTGLPPDPQLLEAFLAQPTEQAYQVLVDSLLSSPHFGERWAAMWLDLARYADSNGYEADQHRNIWRFRDWVINAFNQDMPFDQFTIEQLAGDLLHDPGTDQLIATAFNRNTMTNTEGGTIDEEFRTAAVIDRLNTTFEVWQSTSIGCVQCHSHPYDPFKHEEYYQLMAYFNNTQDADLPSMTPTLAFWEQEDTEKIKGLISYIREMDGSQEINDQAHLQTQMRQSLFPILIPQWCDDFQNVQVNNDGSVTNHLINYSDGLKKQLYFKFDNIDLTGLKAIGYDFGTKGPDARIAVHLDSIRGPVIQQVDLPFTSPGNNIWDQTVTRDTYLLSGQAEGNHHLVFELINTTAKAPDGLVSVKQIELVYEDRPQRKELISAKEELQKLRLKADLTPIMKPKAPGFERPTHVFNRGSWLVPEEQVNPALPQTLASEKNIGNDRLALAQWMVSPENPLTARVLVNRVWEQLFGTGIVPTVEDFGTQAEGASHPKLLDFLSLQLMNEHQWSIKSLLKEIVLSATYCQSSVVTAEKLELDPYNEWLSRGPRFRLSAEQIRDQALAVSGLLDRTIGGKSVMPPQPEGIWQVIYNSQKWETKKEEQYRRGLYTYWKRTTPYPSMVSFDSPSREFCVSRRIRTNTPLQALVTLNDPVYVEAAQALAKKMQEGNNHPRQAIKRGYYLALMEEPDDQAIEALETLYQQALEDPPLTHGESVYNITIDPMTVVANAIMNLDSFIMKE